VKEDEEYDGSKVILLNNKQELVVSRKAAGNLLIRKVK
jgi:hypothetical protein